MTTKTITYAVKLTKTPTDGSGYFEAIVANWEIDSDNERFARDAFDDLDGSTPIPLRYQHTPKEADPAATIGMVFAQVTDAGLKVKGQLNLANPMAVAVYERMLLPADDPNALREFSVGFQFEPAKVFKGPKGETVIPKAKLIEVSIVYKGAQRTELLSIKAAPKAPTGALARVARYILMGLEEEVGDFRSLANTFIADLRAAGQTDFADAMEQGLAAMGYSKAAPPAVQGDALAQFAAMKKELIQAYPSMARDVFGELTPAEKKALAARKARDKAAFDGPVAESPEPKIDARFRVINPPAAIPDREPEAINLAVAEFPDDAPIRAGQLDDGRVAKSESEWQAVVAALREMDRPADAAPEDLIKERYS